MTTGLSDATPTGLLPSVVLAPLVAAPLVAAPAVAPPASSRPGRWLSRIRSSRIHLWWSLGFVLLGATIEVRAYAFNRSLWLDEASISLNITQRGFRALIQPLGLSQAAPIGWLWLQHAAVRAFGPNEQALRLLPLLSGLVSLLLFWAVAHRMLSRAASAVAVALFAVSPFLLEYATEVKPYATDVTCGLLLLLAALALQPDRRPRPWHYALWALLGSALVWLSSTSLLVFLGLTAALMLTRLRGRDYRAIGLLVASTVPLLVSLAVDYQVALKASSTNTILLSYWQAGFLPSPVALGTAGSWLGQRAQAFVLNPLGLGGSVAPALLPSAGLLLSVALLLAIGLHSLRGERSPHRTLLLVAFLPFLGAACVHLYPFSARLILVLVPFALLLLAASVGHRAPALRYAALAIVLGLLGSGTLAAARLVTHPAQREELATALDFVARHHQPGDILLVDQLAQPAFAFYGPTRGLTQTASFSTTATPASGCQDQARLAAIVGRRRVWLIFSHTGVHDPDLGRTPRARLALYGRPTLSLAAYGAGAYGYEPARRAPGASAPVTPDPTSRCLRFSPGPLAV